MKTAACYVRVSTDDQLEFSPDSQLKVIRAYAEKNNIILLEDFVFMEDGGKSGKTIAHRDRFLELMACAKRKPKPFDMILVWKFSRFTRNQEEAITLKSMLKRNGIDVVSISEPIPDGPFGDLIERIVEWTDEYYLTNLRQEVRRGMKERASRGLPVSVPPIGYSIENGRYVPNDKAPLVQNIFNDFLSGAGLRAIAVKYSNMGMTTRYGNPVDNRFVEYVLRNQVYIGKIRWSSGGRGVSTRHYDSKNIMIFQGVHEPIITEDVFNAVQEKLDMQKKMYGKYQRKEQPTDYMLKGLVRCSACNATLIRVCLSHSPSFQCHNYARGSCHVSHSIKIDWANNAVIDYLQKVVDGDEFSLIPSTGEHADFQEDYTKLIANEKAKLARVKAAYQNGIDTIDEYRVNKAKITEAIRSYEQAAAEAQAKPALDKKAYRDKLSGVLSIVRDPSQSEKAKNEALRTVIEKIIYQKPSGTFEIYFH